MKKWDVVIKQDPKHPNVFGFFLVSAMGSYRTICMVETPNDGQLNDSTIMCGEIKTAIMKRLRKSV